MTGANQSTAAEEKASKPLQWRTPLPWGLSEMLDGDDRSANGLAVPSLIEVWPLLPANFARAAE